MPDSIRKSRLLLSDGSCFDGFSFGWSGVSSGEAVFSTAMVGYPESLTDPSYSGQILCASYPLIGNYGVPADTLDSNGLSASFESGRIWVRGLVTGDYSWRFSHWDAVRSLDSWLKEFKVPGIWGVDTRELTKYLRDHGSMPACIVPEGERVPSELYDPGSENQLELVSCKAPVIYGSGRKTVVLLDCGVKHNIIRCLLGCGLRVVRVPWNYDFSGMDYDGLLISNGPGNPELCDAAVANIRKAMRQDIPIFGICMGNQLLARAAGASTYKLGFGHRGHNQPVMMAGGRRCFVTSQNHGYAVDESTLPPDWESWFVNMNDGSNEGIRHRSKPFFSVQFHPEASSGPTDTGFLFDEFKSLL